MSKITIQVIGNSGVGKTTIAEIIRRVILKEGFKKGKLIDDEDVLNIWLHQRKRVKSLINSNLEIEIRTINSINRSFSND